MTLISARKNIKHVSFSVYVFHNAFIQAYKNITCLHSDFKYLYSFNPQQTVKYANGFTVAVNVVAKPY